MLDYLEDYEDDELDKIFDMYADTLENREEMLRAVKLIPLSARRESLVWRSVIDKDGNRLRVSKTKFIKDIDTDHLKAILKHTGYNHEDNSSIVLYTINEELINRKKC